MSENVKAVLGVGGIMLVFVTLLVGIVLLDERTRERFATACSAAGGVPVAQYRTRSVCYDSSAVKILP